MAKKATKTKIRKNDPVVTEILRNGIIAVTEEMKTNLMRTAYNPIIYEALDFTVGLYTAKGETVSIGLGLAVGTISPSAMLRKYSGMRKIPCESCPAKWLSTSTSATCCARSSGAPAWRNIWAVSDSSSAFMRIGMVLCS